MKPKGGVMLMLWLLTGHAWADCASPVSGADAQENQQAIDCVHQELDKYENANAALKNRIQELEQQIFGTPETIESESGVSPNRQYSQHPLAITVKTFRKDQTQLLVELEYENISKDRIHLDLSSSRDQIWVADENGTRWHFRDNSPLGAIAPSGKLAATLSFAADRHAGLPQSEAFTFHSRYILNAEFLTVRINDISP